jgi:hypothetical protein
MIQIKFPHTASAINAVCFTVEGANAHGRCLAQRPIAMQLSDQVCVLYEFSNALERDARASRSVGAELRILTPGPCRLAQ